MTNFLEKKTHLSDFTFYISRTITTLKTLLASFRSLFEHLSTADKTSLVSFRFTFYPRQMPFRVDPSPHNFNSLSSSPPAPPPPPPPPPHPPIGDLKVFYNTRFKGVLLRVENINFFLPIYPKICWCQQVVYYFFGRS